MYIWILWALLFAGLLLCMAAVMWANGAPEQARDKSQTSRNLAGGAAEYTDKKRSLIH